jgi:tetratricopeptide (TPR) repeat protein
MTGRAQRFAIEGRLVVFVGAGVSSIPPTCLPSWWGINQSVVAVLRDQAAKLVGAERAHSLAESISGRQQANQFPPEYQAEVIVRKLRHSYFKVLQCLDSDTPNDVHLQIAALAKMSVVCGVVTTNFDHALEAAFRELGMAAEVWSNPGQFHVLADRFASAGKSESPCPILKLHGSAENPDTLIDTLSQRKRGFAPPVSRCVRHLLREAHWLFLGYSGADLMADPNYLFLKPDASDAQGFTWLVRSAEKTVPAVANLCDIYGDRAEIVYGELPEWILRFSEPWLKGVVPRTKQLSQAEVAAIEHEAAKRVTNHAAAWAAAERFDRNVLVFAALLEAVGEPAAALEIEQQLYDTWPIEDRMSGHFGVAANALGNAYNQASRFEEAKAVFQEVLRIFDRSKAPEQYLGTMNNLALVYVMQGRAIDALPVYEQLLEFAVSRDDKSTQAVALHNIAMIRRRLGEDDEAERRYLEEVDILREIGDEPALAVAFNNLGEIAISSLRLDGAKEFLNKALAIRERLGDDLGAASTSANLANVHFENHEYDTALSRYKQSLVVFKRFSDRANHARTLANMARAMEAQGRRADAKALSRDSLAEATEIASDVVRAEVLDFIGEIQLREQRYQEATGTFQKLVELAVRMQTTRAERDARVGYGIALTELNDFSRAIMQLRVGLAISDKYGFPVRWRIPNLLADALNKQGLSRQETDPHGALGDFLESLQIWQSAGQPFNEGQTLLNVGNTYLLLKQYQRAAQAFLQSEGALTSSGDHDGADDAALLAGRIYLSLSQLDEAGRIFREVVKRSASYEERTNRMNRIGGFAQEQLQRGASDLAVRVLEDCAKWNYEDGYLPDAAACFLNLAVIFRVLGVVATARQFGLRALELLKGEPQHSLVAQANALLASLPEDK